MFRPLVLFSIWPVLAAERGGRITS
jgi:hypothetical protein